MAAFVVPGHQFLDHLHRLDRALCSPYLIVWNIIIATSRVDFLTGEP
jgi:hypothetical protein